MSRFKAIKHDHESGYFEEMIEKKTRRGRPYSPYTTMATTKKSPACKRSSSKRKAGAVQHCITNNNEIESSSLIEQIIQDETRRLKNRNHQHQHHHTTGGHYVTRNGSAAATPRTKQVPFDTNVYRNVPNVYESDSDTDEVQQIFYPRDKTETAAVPDLEPDDDDGGGGGEDDEDCSGGGGDGDSNDGNNSGAESESAATEVLDVFDNATEVIELDDDDHNESRRRSQTKSDQAQSLARPIDNKFVITEEERSDSVIITGSYTPFDLELEEISRIRTNSKSAFHLFFSLFHASREY